MFLVVLRTQVKVEDRAGLGPDLLGLHSCLPISPVWELCVDGYSQLLLISARKATSAAPEMRQMHRIVSL